MGDLEGQKKISSNAFCFSEVIEVVKNIKKKRCNEKKTKEEGGKERIFNFKFVKEQKKAYF